MPPKVKITKKMVEDASIEIIRKHGHENLNARTIAEYLGCSTVGRHIVTGDYRILFRAISPVAVCVLRADCTLSKVKLQSIAALFQLPLHGQLK